MLGELENGATDYTQAALKIGFVFGWRSKREKAQAQAADVAAAERLIADGNRAEEAGDMTRACQLYRQAVAAAPQHAAAHLNLGIGLEAAGDDAGAQASYESALRCEPGHPAAAYNLGKLFYTRKAYPEADELLRQALQARPDFAEAHIVRGYVLHALGQLDAAERELRAGLEKRPQDGAAQAALARVLAAQSLAQAVAAHQAGRRDEAEAGDQAALAHDPEHAVALHLRGVLAWERGDAARAAALLTRSLEVAPSNAQAHFDLGRLRESQDELPLALESYRRALALEPAHAEALFNLAGIEAQQGRLHEAIAAYTRLLERERAHPAALCNLGTALKTLGRRSEALERYRQAIEAAPQFADAHYNLGLALREQGRVEEALTVLERCVELAPGVADAHFALGHALRDCGRNDDAGAAFERALALDPDHAQARWSRTMAYLPAVQGAGEDLRASRERFGADLADLEHWFEGRRVEQAAIAVGTDQPFELAYQEEDNRPLLARYGALCARLMDDWRQRHDVALPVARPHRPLRVGIVSAHLRNHSVWSAITRGWFEALDGGRVALHAFHLGVDEDAETSIARSRAARYERGPKSLEQWIDRIRASQPDVLIYPEVGIDPMTVRLASLRLAPVQATTWGHPETSGLPTIDYYLSAEDLEPPEADAYYTERLVRLPRLGCRFRRMATVPVKPDLAPLFPEARAPLLVCPGVPFKYAARHDWVFPAIAQRLGRCRFVFFTHRTRVLSEKLEQRLRGVFESQGLDFSRYVAFLPWQPVPQFAGWLREADVFLDTIGFSGFNTALHAVEAGLPIVTREGRFLRGRLASGILKRLGVAELVVPTEEAYVELAVRLAREPAYRRAITAKMEAGRDGLYDDAAPVRALEEFLVRAAS